jgi:uncharacterized membrane protein
MSLNNNGESESVGGLARDLLQDTAHVIEAEFRLAREEAKSTARRLQGGIGLLAGAGVTALMLACALTAAVILLLYIAMPFWLAALFTAILVGGQAFGAFILAWNKLQDVELFPHRTWQSVKRNAKLT